MGYWTAKWPGRWQLAGSTWLTARRPTALWSCGWQDSPACSLNASTADFSPKGPVPVNPRLWVAKIVFGSCACWILYFVFFFFSSLGMGNKTLVLRACPLIALQAAITIRLKLMELTLCANCHHSLWQALVGRVKCVSLYFCTWLKRSRANNMTWVWLIERSLSIVYKRTLCINNAVGNLMGACFQNNSIALSLLFQRFETFSSYRKMLTNNLSNFCT